MKIQVRIKTVYGKETVYPVCEKALTFAAIAGTVTLNPKDIERIKSLGFTVEVVAKTPSTL